MNKFLLATLFILSIFAHAAAQDDDPNLDSIPPLPSGWNPTLGDTCYNPSVENFSMIHYQTYSKVYMEIKGANGPLSAIGFKELGTANDYQARNLQSDGGLVLSNLLPGHLYSIQTVNSCGEPIAMAFDVSQETNQDMIHVPAPFFDAIADYVGMDNPIPFRNYLNSLTDISPYVKTAFIQQYFFRGRRLDTDLGDLVPAVPPLVPDSCFCNMLVTDEYAAPAIINPDKTFSDKGWHDQGKKRKIAGEDGSNYWFYMNNQGAAKWHQLYTTGYKTTKGRDLGHNMTWQTGDTSSLNYISSYQQGRIRMNLLCMDGNTIPKECVCTRDVELGYEYNTRLHTDASVGKGLSGSKNAVAQVEDMAIISFFEELDIENTYDPIGFLLARHKAVCNRELEPSFWTKAADIYITQLEIGYALLGFKDAKKIDTVQIRKLGNAVVKQVNNYIKILDNPEGKPSSCVESSHVNASKNGRKSKKIRPNKACSFEINSFDKLFCSGRRNWFSTAYAVSDFYLTVVISPNSLYSEPSHCCSPGVASWVIGACAGSPLDKPALKKRVNGIIRSVLTTFDSTKVISQDYGFTTSPVTANLKCNKLPVNPNSGGFDSGNHDRSFSTSGTVALSIWDATGKMIANFKTEDAQSGNLDTLVQEKLSDVSAGIYFIRIESKGQISTKKIFIR